MKGQRIKGGGGGFKESSLNYIFCKFLFVAILKFVQIPTTLCPYILKASPTTPTDPQKKLNFPQICPKMPRNGPKMTQNGPKQG